MADYQAGIIPTSLGEYGARLDLTDTSGIYTPNVSFVTSAVPSCGMVRPKARRDNCSAPLEAKESRLAILARHGRDRAHADYDNLRF